MKDWMRKIIIFVAVAAVAVLVLRTGKTAEATVFSRMDRDTAVAGASLLLRSYYDAHENAENELYVFIDEQSKDNDIQTESVAADESVTSEENEEEAKRIAEEKAAEEASIEAAQKAAEEAAQKASEEAAAKKAAEEAAAKKASEEAAKKASEEAAAEKKAAEEASKQASSGASEAQNTTGRQIADYAATFVGVLPYVWGGTSLTTGCDCSGFVASIYAKFGYLDATKAAYHYYDSKGLRYVGRAVTYDDSSLATLITYLQPGDIICYEGHVAMYYGNGVVVHEPSRNRKAEYGSVMMKPIITIRRLVSSTVVTPTETQTEATTAPTTAPQTSEEATSIETETPTEAADESTETTSSESETQEASTEPTDEAPSPDYALGQEGEHMQVEVKNPKQSYDIIVVGAGPAGCAAAICAGRMGANVLLLEATTAPGGMATMGLVSKWAPFTDNEKVIYKGFPYELLSTYKKRAGIPEEKWRWVNIDPEILKVVYDELLAEAHVHVLYQSRVVDVVMEGEKVKTLIVAAKNGLTPFDAKVVIDATGDGDVATFSGCEFEIGGSQGELQPGSLCFTIAGADLSKKGDEQLNSNPKDGLWAQIRDEKHYPRISKHFIPAFFGNSIVLCNAGHLFQVDSTNPEEVSKAMVEGRSLAFEYLAALKEYRPEIFKDAYIVQTAPLLGVRESRRIIGDYYFTVEDYLARRSFEDEIGRDSYWLDCHGKHDSVSSTSVGYGPGESHGIPWRCLLPKHTENLLVAGRCISCDRMSLAALRVMPNCLVEGEACGIGAALAVQNNITIREVDVKEIQKRQ